MPTAGLGPLDGLRPRATGHVETDSLASTRAVESRAVAVDCEGMFDVLTYQKGGALLHMLEQFLGAEPFRAGVGRYLREHAYSNTETNDLLGRHRGDHRPTGAADDGLVDLAARLPIGDRRARR